MLAGVDVSFIWSHVLRAWAAVACTELNSFRNVLTHPRNILAFQGGVEAPLPFLPFGRLALQGVYLSPFFGAHYELGTGENPWNCYYNTDYVNKGVPLTYPMEPDSLECLLVLEAGLGRGWNANLVAKYQARSAQYATSETAGTTYETKMDYSKTGQYKMKDFFGNIFSHILSVGLDVSKAFGSLPLRLRLGLRFEGDWTRAFSIAGADARGNVGCNLGDGTTLGEWNAPVHGVFGSLGLQIYY